MAAGYEGGVLDGLDLNDGANYTIERWRFTPGKKKLQTVESSDSDGPLLADEEHYEAATFELRVRVAPRSTHDAARQAIGTVTTKLQKAARSRPSGIGFVWTPDGSSTSRTWYVVSGELTELPVEIDGEDAGWEVKAPVFTVVLTCRPFGYSTETTPNLTDSDPFNRDTIAEGRWLGTAVGTVAVSGGVVTVSSTANKVLYRPISVENATATIKVHVGAAAGLGGVVLAYIDSSNYLFAGLVSGTTIAIRKLDGGASTTLASTGYVSSLNTDYWVRLVKTGNVLTLTIYTSDPDAGASAAGAVSYTLIGADATKFGSGVKGNPGVRTAPGDTAWTLDDWRLDSAWIESSNPHIDFEIRNTAGEVPAEGRLILTDIASQERDFAEFGLEALEYPHSAPPATMVAAQQLSTSGLSGSGNTRAGAFLPQGSGNSVIRGGTGSAWVGLCEALAQVHVGAFRAKVRVWTDGTDVQLRLAYRAGDGAFIRNSAVDLSPSLVSQWQEVDLGPVYIEAAGLGTQQFVPRIELRGDTALKTVDLNYLELIPAERYGYARSPAQSPGSTPSVLAGADEFNQAAANLDAAAAARIGGSWSEASKTGANGYQTTGTEATRTTTNDADLNSGCYAVLGSSVASCGVLADVQWSNATATTTPTSRHGVLARYSNTSNWLMAVLEPAGFSARLVLYKRVGGTVTQIDATPQNGYLGALGTYYRIMLLVDAAGNYTVSVGLPGSTLTTLLSGSDPDLATGGALASGKAGIYDAWSQPSGNTRAVDNFASWAPDPDAAIYSGRALEFRSDDTLRQDSGGTGVYARPQIARGARFFIPQAGSGRVTRIVVKAARNDIVEFPRDQVADALRVEARSTARYLLPA